MLAKKGANVDYPEEHGYTPLAHTDSIPVATALLDLGASVEGSSLRPSLPMAFALMRDDLGKGDLHAHTYLKHIRHMDIGVQLGGGKGEVPPPLKIWSI